MKMQPQRTRDMIQLKNGKHKGLTISVRLLKSEEGIKLFAAMTKNDEACWNCYHPLLTSSDFADLSCYFHMNDDELWEIIDNDLEAKEWFHQWHKSQTKDTFFIHQDFWNKADQ